MKIDLVVKSNALIEASYRLSLQEQRIVLNLASKIKPTDENFQDYTFKVAEFAELADTTTDMQYSRIKAISSKLLSRLFTINEADGPLQISWLSSVKYHNNEGKITLRFDPALKPYLLKLKNCFTKLSLESLMSFKSSFSIRIYELLKQYEAIGTRDFLLSDLRTILGLEAAEYPKYGNFKAKVLMVAKKEINKKTNLFFDFEEIKSLRKVHTIRFKINKKDKNLHDKPCYDAENDHEIKEIIDLLPETHRTQKTILSAITTFYKKYGSDYVDRNIRYTNKNAKSNYRTYLLKALKQDYGLAMKEDEDIQQKIIAQKKSEQHKIEQQKAAEQERLRIEQENKKRVKEYIASLPEEEKLNLKAQALADMSETNKAIVLKNGTGAKSLLNIEIEKIALKNLNDSKSTEAILTTFS